jgi:predicted RNase H-like HicB family nuclease
VPELPGVLAYGASRDEALAKAEVLALRVIAEQSEHGEGKTTPIRITLAVVFAFHDGEEIGPCMLARVFKHPGLSPTDL